MVDPAELEEALDADAERVSEVMGELAAVEPGFIAHVRGILVQRGQVDEPRLTLAELYDPRRPDNPGGGRDHWRLITGQETGYLGTRTYSRFRKAEATARALLREKLRRAWAFECYVRERRHTLGLRAYDEGGA